MKVVEKRSSKKQAGWAWDLPKAETPQLALSFYEHLQLRLPRGKTAAR